MKISELLIGISKLNHVLPEFQREYVWTREQAKQLFVSLYKEYPTGTLLFWKTDNPPDIKNAEALPEHLGTTDVILDGQQRLTTLYLLMRGEIPPYYREIDIQNDPRNLYFSLETCEFRYYQAKRMDPDPAWVSVVDCFAKQDAVNPLAIAQAKAEEGENPLTLGNRFYNNLNRLTNIRERDYPIQVVPPTADIDDAIDVFDRVNSMGTTLTEAELALAHMTGKWPHARRLMKAKMEELASKRFRFDLTFMVRALTGVVKQRAILETIHQTPREELEEGWDTLKRILDYLVSLLPGRAHIHSTDDINSTNTLVPVIVYLAQHGRKFDTEAQLRRCVHWLYATNLWGRYTGQTTNRLDHDLAIVQRQDNPWPELVDAIIDQRGRIDVKPSDFEGRSIQHPLYRMSYIAVKANGAVDWFNGSSLVEPHGKTYQIHSHHIFPSSLLYSEGAYDPDNHLDKKVINEIANRAFLTGDSNVSLGNERPSEYLPRVRDRFPGAIAKQFVPVSPELWELGRYEAFLEERRRLLADAVNALLGGLLAPVEEQAQVVSAADLVRQEESAALEFKSSLRWDVRQQQVNKALEKVIAKSVAGFLNAEGGTLLIGVTDDGEVLGLEDDVKSLGRSDLDGFYQKLTQVLDNHIGTEFLHNVKARCEEVGGHQVCVVEVKPSPSRSTSKTGRAASSTSARATPRARSTCSRPTTTSTCTGRREARPRSPHHLARYAC